ncbi:MAG: SIR2 family protein, partial [Cyclobacteriaceae bacterium]
EKANHVEELEQQRLRDEYQQIQYESSYWVSFTRLQKALGQASYVASMRQYLNPPSGYKLPRVYEDIWSLRISGVLTMNLDRLVTIAHAKSDAEIPINEFMGKESGLYTHLLQQNRPYIVNLHGVIDNERSWVFTQEELHGLLRNKAYCSFIRTCASTHTILFMGISAEDIAAGGHLERLRKDDVLVGDHFWLTDRNDAISNKWAEENGIQKIFYSNSDGKHTQVEKFISLLVDFVPTDEELGPIHPNTYSGTTAIPPVHELITMPPSTIRDILNGEACRILSSGSKNSYNEYKEFCDEYDQAIHGAWYISTKPHANKLYSYSLGDQLGYGAFGNVYRATDVNGKDVAVKILRQEIRDNPEMLQGFRRGVKSMQILSSQNVKGVVKYLDAGEIPAFTVMELIEGPTLAEAVSNRQVDSWAKILNVASSIADILKRSHELPERVLHRDIRPANILI